MNGNFSFMYIISPSCFSFVYVRCAFFHSPTFSHAATRFLTKHPELCCRFGGSVRVWNFHRPSTFLEHSHPCTLQIVSRRHHFSSCQHPPIHNTKSSVPPSIAEIISPFKKKDFSKHIRQRCTEPAVHQDWTEPSQDERWHK